MSAGALVWPKVQFLPEELGAQLVGVWKWSGVCFVTSAGFSITERSR